LLRQFTTSPEEQLALHTAQRQVIQAIVRKKHISEIDRSHLQKALLLLRMAADSTVLVDRQGREWDTEDNWQMTVTPARSRGARQPGPPGRSTGARREA
jgi:hypothetical protein